PDDRDRRRRPVHGPDRPRRRGRGVRLRPARQGAAGGARRPRPPRAPDPPRLRRQEPSHLTAGASQRPRQGAGRPRRGDPRPGSAGSSLDRGESLKDTVQTLSAYDRAAIVIRSPHAGAAQLVAGWTPAAVINAGDGKHEHPTQALLDAFTLRRRLGRLDGARIWIVGDVLHSRVARSNILALQRMGATVTVCGPPTLIPRDIEALGCDAAVTLDRVHEADVVYVLRMQQERMRDSFLPSLREYAARYQISAARLRPGQLLMHPGPVNRGIELSADAIDSDQALIGAQVKAGVAVRMAVLYELLVGAPVLAAAA